MTATTVAEKCAVIKAANFKPGVTERSARAIRLKEELNLILELVVHSRESLNNELNSEFAQKKLSVDKPFISKLKDVSACYNSLTDARIRLDKAEKALEAEMTPAEEMAAVRAFIMALDNKERIMFLNKLFEAHKRITGGPGRQSLEDEPMNNGGGRPRKVDDGQ